MMRKPLIALLLSLAGALVPPSAHADLYIIVQAVNPTRALTQKEALDLFMGRTRAFANGEFALPFDLPRDSATRTAFYLALTGMSPAQVNSYWARLMFTGQTMPPQALPNDAAMVEIVKRNPSAIGYLAAEPVDKGLRTVLIIKEPH